MTDDLRKLLHEAACCVEDMGNKTTPYTAELAGRLRDAALAQPAAEPVAWINPDGSLQRVAGKLDFYGAVYAAPPSVGQIKAQALREAVSRFPGLEDSWIRERLERLASEHERGG
jgi:hypothetical protein